MIDLDLPWSADEIEGIVHQTMARNDPTDVTIRIIATGGQSPNFMVPTERPSLAVMLAPVTPANPLYLTQGARLITVEMERFMPAVKSLNYVTAIMAQKRARAAGVVEALYRDADGMVSECTTSNFFIFRGDRLITSNVDILAGITRGAALEIAEDLFQVEERPIRYDELTLADEAFITSTTKEIMPVVRVDDIVIGQGGVGAATRRMMETFRQLVSLETGFSFGA
jgi:branched-chain amino acid aminotransferase